jgi:two-component system, NtrC family, C4-dicarboxylate transport sensor histidine kinase DctB
MRLYFSAQQKNVSPSIVTLLEHHGYECHWQEECPSEDLLVLPADIVVSDSPELLDKLGLSLDYHSDSASASGPHVILILQPNDRSGLEASLRRGVNNILFSPVSHDTLLERITSLARSSESHALQVPKSVVTASAELSHLERLSTLGTLTASLMHELNNHLCYIQGTADLLVRTTNKLVSTDEATQTSVSNHIERLKTGIGHMSQLIHSVQTFARASHTGENISSFEHCLQTSADLLSWSHRHAIKLDTSGVSSCCLGIAEQQLTQVLLNILINASHAMHDIKERLVYASTEVKDSKVIIRIRDTGSGIPEAVLPTIWEPFFTTKGSLGNGLGLFICRRIIEDAGGSISICNHPERGAEVSITLNLVAVS